MQILRFPLVCVLGASFFPLFAIQQTASNSPALAGPGHKHPKLATHLADLARAVPQRTTPLAPGENVSAPEGFSVAKLPKSARDAIKAGQMKVSDAGEVQVYVELHEITRENLGQLRSYGFTVQIIGKPKPDKSKREVLTAVPTAQGMLPIEMIHAVAALPFVRYIRLPDYGFTSTGSVDSQGDQILHAMQARAQFGVDGTGVKVGVISDGIGGIFATGCTTCGPTTATPSPITLGDLPNATGTRNASGVLVSVIGGITARSFPSSNSNLEPPATDTASGVSAEGTAMLEIVHDLAPGAQLYFANPADSASMSFQQAVDYLAANTDVVVDDLSFLTPPFDGTSTVSMNTATVLNTDANRIRGYFTAVGNLVFNHWEEPWTDSGTSLNLALGNCPSGQAGNLQLFHATAATNDLHSVGPSLGNTLSVPNGATVSVFLTWDAPSASITDSAALYLNILSSSGPVTASNFGSPVACAVTPITVNQAPFEMLNWTNNLGGTVNLAILIQNPGGQTPPHVLDMFVFDGSNGPDLNYYTPAGSVPAEADAGGSPVSVVSVGAIDQTQCSATGICSGSVERYSSQGPTEATPQAAARMKPDVTATDGVSVTGAGGFGFSDTLAPSPCPVNNPSPPGCFFFGSSAASPHAAAIAALTLQAAPCLLSSSTVNTPAKARTNLRNLLTNTAVPLPGISQAVPNDIEGFGLLDTLAAITATLPTVNASTNQTVNATSSTGANVTVSGSATDPDSCPVTFSWTGNCGTASTASATLTCPAGNDAETLTVSNGGVKMSLPSSTVQITVSDFTDALSPASATISPGQTASYTVTIGSKFGAFTNPVSLACSGLPSLSTCGFSPPSVTPGSSSATSTLTISTTAPSLVLPLVERRIPNVPIFVLWLGLILALAVVAVLARKSGRKHGFAVASCALLICLIVPIFSCGGGGGGPHNLGTPPGTYSVTVTGTSNQLLHSTTLTLTVQ